jgi:hypothetical protein
MHPSDSTHPATKPSPIPDAADGVVHLQTVEARPITWLWPNWIPARKITVVDGDPGLGKSTLLLDLAARISRRDAMPDGSRGLFGDVLLLTAEDSLEDTVKPRLLAAGANLERIHSLRTVRDSAGLRPPVLPDDIGRIEELIKAYQVVMVVIDPLVAFLSSGLDTGRDHHMRRALYPLLQVAERQECAMVLLRHLNKGMQAKALYRGGGSIGIIAAARAGLLVARDPTDAKCQVVLVSKSNLAVVPTGLKYELVPTENRSVAVAWRGPSYATPDGVLETSGGEEAKTALEEAGQFLTALLGEKDYQYRDLIGEARASGIQEKTLRRAKRQLGIRSYRVGNQRKGMKWIWSLQASAAAAVAASPGPADLEPDRASACPQSWADILARELTSEVASRPGM